MAVPTEAQRADIYYFCGWPQRYIPSDAFKIENAINSIAQVDAQWAIIANSLYDTPVGLLAQLRQLQDVTIPAAYERLQVMEVGPIKMDGGRELRELRNQGRRLTSALCKTLGVRREGDVFGTDSGIDAAATMGGEGGRPGNWIGRC